MDPMIPQDKTEAVTRALHDAFGVSAFEEIRKLPGGLTSALVFRIVVRGSPFLLRIIMRTDDPACHFICMRTAAEAGLAPRVWYTSVEDRLSITDFVEAVPFSIPEGLARMPRTLQALHGLPPFPARASHLNTTCTFFLNKGPAVDGFIQSFRAANLVSKSETDEALAVHAQLAAAYSPPDADLVSCHNDLFKPDNVLFDGQRVWMVDWEAAFLNDRYADLAVVTNLLVTNTAEETTFLQDYFGQPPDPYQLARYFLMQQVVHLFYGMVFLLLGSSGAPADCGENAPDFRDFNRRLWAGEVKLDNKQSRTAFGGVHWEQLLQNTRQPRFNEALKIVAGRQAPDA
jgi:aminoglycoside phosphotransferase (APT) family kinase protein